MLEVVIITLLAVHLLCVNVASGGPLVAAWLDSRGGRGDEAAAQAAVFLARLSLLGLVAGAMLGVAVGWLKWDEQYESLWLGPLSYKLKWAVIEAVFSLALMLGWWLWLPGRAGGSRGAIVARGFIALLAATNLLYHFPLLFAAAAHLQAAGATSGETIGGAGFRELMVRGEIPAIAIHVVLASVAVAGVALLGWASGRLGRGDLDKWAVTARFGARVALAASLAQFPVGLWTLSVLPAEAQSMILGQSTTGTLLFAAAMAAALWLINDLAQVAMGEASRPLLIRTVVAMLTTVALMTAMQQQARL